MQNPGRCAGVYVQDERSCFFLYKNKDEYLCEISVSFSPLVYAHKNYNWRELPGERKVMSMLCGFRYMQLIASSLPPANRSPYISPMLPAYLHLDSSIALVCDGVAGFCRKGATPVTPHGGSSCSRPATSGVSSAERLRESCELIVRNLLARFCLPFSVSAEFAHLARISHMAAEVSADSMCVLIDAVHTPRRAPFARESSFFQFAMCSSCSYSSPGRHSRCPRTISSVPVVVKW